MTSDAASKIFRLIDVPSSVNIEMTRSFYGVSEPGVNLLSCLHADLLWIKFLDETRDVTVLDTDVVSVKMRNRHGGIITFDMKDMPAGAYELDDAVPP